MKMAAPVLAVARTISLISFEQSEKFLYFHSGLINMLVELRPFAVIESSSSLKVVTARSL